MVPDILNIVDFPAAFGILIGATVIDLGMVAVAFKDFLSKGDKKDAEEKAEEKAEEE